MRSFTELPPLSLYIHLPWCVRKCPYCDFNSHEQKGEIPEDQYINAVLEDLALEMPRVWGRSIVSVFIGGGTPSVMSAKAIDTLLSGVRALTALAPNAEVTMEANPGTFEQEKFKDFRAAGINRLSIGVQSFNDAALEKLGRIHSAGEAQRAVDIAQNAGFDDINIDLMFGLPGQTYAEALHDIDTAIALSPTHISYYELTLEPNTYFAKYPPALPPDDTRWQIHEEAIDRLSVHGYGRYEISAYAKSQHQSEHNKNYWLFGDYVGIGAGAHGKVSFADSGKIERSWKHKHPTRYMDSMSRNIQQPNTVAGSPFMGGLDPIATEDTAIEFMMNALRLKDGFEIPLFQQHTGVTIDRWQQAIQQSIDAGLLQQSGLRLHATQEGFNFLNDLVAYFIPDNEPVRSYPTFSIRPE
jgi:oxygen-independent coproporphyrinogen-3 oxidase